MMYKRISETLSDLFDKNPPKLHETPTAMLALRLATEIDDTSDKEMVAKLSARLLPVMVALGMTKPNIEVSTNGQSTIDELRERRGRLRNATAVDSTTA